MPGPNDWHFNRNGEIKPGLGDDDPKEATAVMTEPPRVDGRTAEAKRLRKLEAMEKELAAERAKLDRERAAFEAEQSGKGDT